jgi:hypothetical protein
MTRTWIAQASQVLRMNWTRTARPRRRRAALRVEDLESRLSLSVAGGLTATPMLNPQPLPPGIRIVDLNPQPLPPGFRAPQLNPQPLPPRHAPSAFPLLNPQPLPPGRIAAW